MIPVQRLSRVYVVALALVAVLACGVHFFMRKVILEHRDTAAEVDVAGRQRMLSQRVVASGATWTHTGKVEARERMLDAVRVLEESHGWLTEGNEARGLSGDLSAELRAHHFDGPLSVDAQLRPFLADARALAETPDPTILASLEIAAAGPLLDVLDRSVHILEEESESRLSWLEGVQDGALLAMILTLLLEALFVFRPLVAQLRRYTDELHELADHDPLTRLLNRRAFYRDAAPAVEALQHGATLSLVAVDLDHFKELNDTHGHAAGDVVLRAVAEALRGVVRGDDVVARMGGEELFIALPDTDESAAATVAERARARIEALAIDHDGVTLGVTASFGVAEVLATQSLDEAMEVTDRALCRAKKDGRNRVVTCREDARAPVDFLAAVRPSPSLLH